MSASGSLLGLASANITASDPANPGGDFSDPRGVVNDAIEENGVDTTWLGKDGTAAWWQATFNLTRFTQLKLRNTARDGRGTKSFRVTHLPQNGIVNFTYWDANHALPRNVSYCTDRCPLPEHNDTTMAFYFVNVIPLTGVRLDMQEWYGDGPGLAGIQWLVMDRGPIVGPTSLANLSDVTPTSSGDGAPATATSTSTASSAAGAASSSSSSPSGSAIAGIVIGALLGALLLAALAFFAIRRRRRQRGITTAGKPNELPADRRSRWWRWWEARPELDGAAAVRAEKEGSDARREVDAEETERREMEATVKRHEMSGSARKKAEASATPVEME